MGETRFAINRHRRRVWAQHYDAVRFAEMLALVFRARQRVVQVRADDGTVGWNVRKATPRRSSPLRLP